MLILRTLALFLVTALAEIGGFYFTFAWLRQRGTAWLLVPAAFSLALFAWLLALHPAATGRVCAAYGGVYIAVAHALLWRVDGVPLTRWDTAGAAIVLLGVNHCVGRLARLTQGALARLRSD